MYKSPMQKEKKCVLFLYPSCIWFLVTLKRICVYSALHYVNDKNYDYSLWHSTKEVFVNPHWWGKIYPIITNRCGREIRIWTRNTYLYFLRLNLLSLDSFKVSLTHFFGYSFKICWFLNRGLNDKNTKNKTNLLTYSIVTNSQGKIKLWQAFRDEGINIQLLLYHQSSLKKAQIWLFRFNWRSRSK